MKIILFQGTRDKEKPLTKDLRNFQVDKNIFEYLRL